MKSFCASAKVSQIQEITMCRAGKCLATLGPQRTSLGRIRLCPREQEAKPRALRNRYPTRRARMFCSYTRVSPGSFATSRGTWLKPLAGRCWRSGEIRLPACREFNYCGIALIEGLASKLITICAVGGRNVACDINLCGTDAHFVLCY